MTERSVRLAVCVPTRGQWEADFGQSLAMALVAFAAHPPEGVVLALKLFNHRGSLLPTQRTEMVREALAWGATHLLMLDDDMAFPMELVALLVRHNLPVVAANCATKAIPPEPTARGLDGCPCYTRKSSRGVERVSRVGTGIMMVKAEVFQQLAEPWFAIPWEEKTGGYVGEDVFFCRRLAEAGIGLFVDHDLSREVSHAGGFSYVHQLMPQYQEMGNDPCDL
jgi:hypothetical protein